MRFIDGGPSSSAGRRRAPVQLSFECPPVISQSQKQTWQVSGGDIKSVIVCVSSAVPPTAPLSLCLRLERKTFGLYSLSRWSLSSRSEKLLELVASVFICTNPYRQLVVCGWPQSSFRPVMNSLAELYGASLSISPLEMEIH